MERFHLLYLYLFIIEIFVLSENFILASDSVIDPVLHGSEPQLTSDTKRNLKDSQVYPKIYSKFEDFKELPSITDHRDVIVHLQDWTYTEIENECPKLYEFGYAAVQISPVTKHAHDNTCTDEHPWDERLSVISYDFDNGSGTEKELEQMIAVCKKNNIKVFADVVINNMAKSQDVNENGENFAEMIYKNKDGSVLYTPSDFHEKCTIKTESYSKDVTSFEDFINLPEKYKEGNEEDDDESSKYKNYQDVLKPLKKTQNIFLHKLNKEGFEMTKHLIDKSNLEIIRTCWLYDRQDLKQLDDKNRPLKPIIDLFNKLLYLGVSGFRIIAADHMDPEHLDIIYNWLPRQRIFIYHDVYDPLRKEFGDMFLIHSEKFTKRTRATDYRFARLVSRTFLRRKIQMQEVYDLSKNLKLLPSEDSVVFVNNFITLGLKNIGIGNPLLEDMFIYPGFPQGDKALQLAISFMLIHNHGIPLITSSKNKDGVYLKEHSGFSTIRHMITFRNVMKKYNNGVVPPPEKFKMYSDHQSSYCIGKTGFVAFNDEWEEKPFQKTVDTCFEKEGLYCDVFGGGLNTGSNAQAQPCSSKSMRVFDGGKKGELKMVSHEGFSAFHVEAMVPSY